MIYMGNVIIAARDDAAEFLATSGVVRSVKLNKAFEMIRANNPGLEASDLQLAEAILEIK